MKSTLTLFIFALVGLLGFSQTPDWVNSDYRESNYPSSQYLVGYAELYDIDKKNADGQLQQLESLTKSKLIESVKVNIKSVSTSNVSDFNGEISDYFNQKTTAESNLQLVGLQTNSYYDKKKQSAHAISYVNKMKMAEYYRSEIGKNISDIENIISQGKSLLDLGHIQQAYKNGLGAYNKFYSIEESQKILLSIGAQSDFETRITDVTELNNSFENYMNGVVSHMKMSIEDMGFIIANGLMKSMGDNKKNIELSQFTFEQTGLSSDFGYKLLESTRKFLPSTSNDAPYVISGTFYYKEYGVEVVSKLANKTNNRIIGENKVSIPEANLLHAGIVVVPKDMERLQVLEIIQISPLNNNISGKAGVGLNEELMASVSQNGKPLSGIPIRFYNNLDQTTYCTSETDKNGNVSCKVQKISGKYKNQVIKAEVNLGRFLQNDSSEYVQKFISNKTLPEASFRVSVAPSVVSLVADENNFGQALDVKLIEPQIKESLSGYGFAFSEDQTEADFVIEIRASSRKGGSVGGVYFAFVDVSIAVFDVNEGREIYKDNITNVKGGGGTFDQAGGKAYYEAAAKAKERIVEIMIQ